MKPNFYIVMELKSPLFQIENKGTISSRKFFIDFEGRKEIVPIPYFTENGLNGILRRVIAEPVYRRAKEKNISIGAEDFHIAFAGGGLNIKENINFDLQAKIANLNKVLSLLGTGLILRRKIAVSGFVPEVKNNDYAASWQIGQFKDGGLYSRLVQRRTTYKKDDIIDGSEFMRLLSDDAVKEWLEKDDKNRSERKESVKCSFCGKEYKDIPANGKCECGQALEKAKKSGVSNIFTKEYIIPGTIMVGSIAAKEDLDDVEYGLLLLGLMNLSTRNIGAGTAYGFGVGNWSIYDDTDNIADNAYVRDAKWIISSKTDTNFFLKPKKVFTNFNGEQESCVEKAKQWIDAIEAENIHIYDIIKKDDGVKKNDK